MKSNQKGITLIELLAASCLAMVIVIAVISIWISNANSATQTFSDTDVQQDAMIVQHTVQNVYNNCSNSYGTPFRIILSSSGQVSIQYESGGTKTVSGIGIIYRYNPDSEGTAPKTTDNGEQIWPAAGYFGGTKENNDAPADNSGNDEDGADIFLNAQNENDNIPFATEIILNQSIVSPTNSVNH
ncbi:MAG: hypothetical protein ABF608_02545 [Sporolactobacillus sp.]